MMPVMSGADAGLAQRREQARARNAAISQANRKVREEPAAGSGLKAKRNGNAGRPACGRHRPTPARPRRRQHVLPAAAEAERRQAAKARDFGSGASKDWAPEPGKWVALAVFAAVFALWTSHSLAKESTSAPLHLVRDFFEQIVAIQRDGGDLVANEQARVISAFSSTFSTDPLARAALGDYWSRATTAQQQHFLELFHLYFLAQYLPMAETASRSRLELIETRSLGNGRTVVSIPVETLHSLVIAHLRLHVADNENSLSLLEVEFAGFAISKLKREEFGAVIRQRGLDEFLTLLQRKVLKSNVLPVSRVASAGLPAQTNKGANVALALDPRQ